MAEPSKSYVYKCSDCDTPLVEITAFRPNTERDLLRGTAYWSRYECQYCPRCKGASRPTPVFDGRVMVYPCPGLDYEVTSEACLSQFGKDVHITGIKVKRKA